MPLSCHASLQSSTADGRRRCHTCNRNHSIKLSSLRCALRVPQPFWGASVDGQGCVPIGTGWGAAYTKVCGCPDLAEFNGRQPRGAAGVGEFGGAGSAALTLTNATRRFHQLDRAALAFRDPFAGGARSSPRAGKLVTVRRGWVPVLTRAVYSWFRPPIISPLPCSSVLEGSYPSGGR